jgi:hypothetical protein
MVPTYHDIQTPSQQPLLTLQKHRSWHRKSQLCQHSAALTWQLAANVASDSCTACIALPATKMAAAAANEHEPGKPEIGYSSGNALMARGSLALHDHVATRLEAAFGDAQPKVEVRFHDLSVSADIMVKDVAESAAELPTLPNELVKPLYRPPYGVALSSEPEAPI